MVTKVKRAAEVVRAPATREEAERLVARIGELQRQATVIEAACAESVSALKAGAEAEARPVLAEIEALTRAVQLWAEANRAALTDGGQRKTVRLGTGEVLWRARPPRVSLRDQPGVIEALVALGLDRFLRVKREVNKEAMLAEPAVARTVPGVSIGSEGEEFVVAPVTATLAGAA